MELECWVYKEHSSVLGTGSQWDLRPSYSEDSSSGWMEQEAVWKMDTLDDGWREAVEGVDLCPGLSEGRQEEVKVGFLWGADWAGLCVDAGQTEMGFC